VTAMSKELLMELMVQLLLRELIQVEVLIWCILLSLLLIRHVSRARLHLWSMWSMSVLQASSTGGEATTGAGTCAGGPAAFGASG
jgi:hypothetical protein